MSISILMVRTLLDAVVAAGSSSVELMRRTDFDPQRLERADERVTVAEYDRLQLAALEATGDEALGLHMGVNALMATFNVVGYLGMHSPTIRDGLAVFFRYHRIISDCAESYLEEADGVATLVYHFPESDQPPLNRLRAEFGLARLVSLGTSFAGPDFRPIDVMFRHPRPSYAPEYERVFGCPVQFDTRRTAVRTHSAMLDKNQLHTNPEFYALLEGQAEILLGRLECERSVTDRVHSLLVENYADVKPDLNSVARHLGTSSRSLRRKLAAEGTSFASERERALGDVARRILADGRTSIQEAGYRMGFSDPSAFHRAFRRWTGMTPKQFQESKPSR